MMIPKTPGATALALIGLLAGCAAGGGPSNPFSEENRPQDVKVYITNLAFMDATVYSVANGARQRLGRVTGKREEIFTLPLRGPADFYLEIDILAGPRCRTERITVDPGDRLELVINTSNPYLFCGGSEG